MITCRKLAFLATAVALLVLPSSAVHAQPTAAATSPYQTSWRVDAPITALGAAASYWGLTILNNKKGLTEAQALALRKTDVPRFDRFAAGNYSDAANMASNYPFYLSFGLAPVLITIDPAMRGHRGQAALLYLETMAVAPMAVMGASTLQEVW